MCAWYWIWHDDAHRWQWCHRKHLLPELAHPDQAYVRLVSAYVPPGLTGLVFAGLLAAILGTVAAGLSASSAMLTYDFALRAWPALSSQRRVLLGRGLMMAVLVLCALAAPGIRQFKGVFTYLVQLWSLLAPPVFVCVVAGVFTRRATSQGATATLVTGTVLGAATFWALGEPAVVEWFPAYLRSPLNWGFLITLVCAAVMIGVSMSSAPPLLQEEVSDPVALPAMTTGERRAFRIVVAGLLFVWVTLVFMFSPWGLAGPLVVATGSE